MNVDVNQHIYDWLENCKSKVVLLYGGSSSGKSYTFKQFIILDKFLVEKNKVFFMFRKTNPSLKISLYKLVLEFLDELGIKYTHNKTDQYIKFNSNVMYFCSIDEPEKYKSIEANYICLEEATEFTEEDYKRLKIALRRPLKDKTDKNQIYLIFNPISTDNYIYINFFEQEDKECSKLQVTYKDNPFLDNDAIATLENEKDELYYSIYTLGNWGAISESNNIVPMQLIQGKYRNIGVGHARGGLDIGVDVARMGDDETVIYFKTGLKVFKPIVLEKKKGYEIAREIINIIETYGQDRRIKVNIDITGVGSGTYDALHEWKVNNDRRDVILNEINFGGTANNPEKYDDCVTELYFSTKEWLENNNAEVPNCDMTATQLCRRSYSITKFSKYKIEPKDIFKKRTGNSPDRADAFVLMIYEKQVKGINLKKSRF